MRRCELNAYHNSCRCDLFGFVARTWARRIQCERTLSYKQTAVTTKLISSRSQKRAYARRTAMRLSTALAASFSMRMSPSTMLSTPDAMNG